MAVTPEYEARQLQLSAEALGDAQYLLADTRLKAAVNRAYYTMFPAAQAALAHEGVSPPKTHSGVRNLFAQRLIQSGKLEAWLSAALAQAADLREKSDYDVYANVGESDVQQLVQQAAHFLAHVRRLS